MDQQSGLMEHLCDLIRVELNDKNQLKSLSELELLSYFLRKNSFTFKQLVADSELKNKIYANQEYTEYLRGLDRVAGNLSRNQNGKVYTMPDLQVEYQAFKMAGVSIGQNNYHFLSKVLRSQAVKSNVKEIKFWGKVLGKHDYYVMQGVSCNPYLHELTVDSEPYGVGANMYSYWVAKDILGEWEELPLVTPQQVKLSRNFKAIFSGDLEKELNGFVKFPGREKHLLKCVIARITHACQLVPKGLYRPSENDPTELEFEEEFKLPEVVDMASLDSWVHFPPHIMSEGRASHYIDESLSPEDKETRKAELEEKEATVERLRGIAEEKPLEINGAYNAPANWTVKQYGETIPVSQIGKEEGQSATYGVACLRNVSWPGATTVGYRGGWANIYVGYGHRETQENKSITTLEDLQAEGKDVEERSEPNPPKAPQPEKAEGEAGEGAAGEGAGEGEGAEEGEPPADQ